MEIFKKLVPVATAVLFTMTLNAQAPGAQSDPEAKKILDQASAKIKSYPAITAAFSFELQDAQGKPQGTKKGSFSMKGNKYKVALTGQEIVSDGTTVWLNAGSSLTYDSTFNKNIREVVLTGEAFFDVAKNKNKPFIIHTNRRHDVFLLRSNLFEG